MCPTCALEARHPNDAALYQRAARAREANGGAAVAMLKWEAVGGRIDPEKVARVTCLGRVEESLLVGLVADGASSVRLVHGSCGECPRNAACETYPLVAETANLLLETWDAPVRVELSEKLPASVRLERPLGAEVSPALAYDEGKRQMFSQLGAAAGEAVASGLAEGDGAGAAEEPESGARQAARFMKVMTDGTLPHFLPDRRERLLDALAVLGDPADVALDTRLWGRVTIDVDACKSCYMCATFCPTGAIRKFADGEDAGVEHIPGDCVKCRCCTDVCPTDALALRRGRHGARGARRRGGGAHGAAAGDRRPRRRPFDDRGAEEDYPLRPTLRTLERIEEPSRCVALGLMCNKHTSPSRALRDAPSNALAAKIVFGFLLRRTLWRTPLWTAGCLRP